MYLVDAFSHLCLFAVTAVALHNFDLQCQTLNEEEIFEVQDRLSLFPLGWIHVSL